MTETDVELVRSTLALFDRGEVEPALERFDENLELDWSRSLGPLNGVYRGRAEVLAFWRAFVEAWDSLAFEIEELTEVADGQVLAVVITRSRGRGSGAGVAARGVQVWTLRGPGGQRITLYQTRDEALAALPG